MQKKTILTSKCNYARSLMQQNYLDLLFQKRGGEPRHSLAKMQALCRALNHPEKDLRFIHIAGTNGKGSVAAMCASILKEAGLSVGLYTSPHLLSYHERFQINGQKISDEELREELALIENLIPDAHFFEITTMIALSWFKKKQVDIVIFETGIGGRLDSTNVITPLLSVITSIGFDHMSYLGNSLKEITREKAGIIKSKIPSITLLQEKEVMDVLFERAKEVDSPLKVITASDLDRYKSPLLGDHQRWNTALSVAAVQEILPSISSSTIENGLKKSVWPGRCQLIEQGNALPKILIDGAHNVQGAIALVDFIEKYFGSNQVTLIYGALIGKSVKETGLILKGIAKEVILTKIATEKSETLENLSKMILAKYACNSFQEALKKANSIGAPIVVAGSLYLVADALAYLYTNKVKWIL
ncbi:MAG: bifunctional folylpolyglutamate synthase/dihydrofolate synthase [Chlamydiales bacterium]|nr:bifunctional folylpolyglutamate synthase/dihydrofolate synthase [Chlamydiales bacterium]